MLVSSMSFSQIFVENFSYPDGTPLATGTGGFWSAGSGAGTNPPAASPPGLTFPSYVGSGIGNSVRLVTSGEDDTSSITPRIFSGTVYSSFMVNVQSAQNVGDYFFALATTGNAFDCRVYARSSGAGFNFGLTKANDAAVTYGTSVYTFNTTYLVIAKYVFNGGANDDEVSLFVFESTSPPPPVEPLPTIGPFTSTAADAINLSRVVIRQGSAANAPAEIIDGIYIDDTWNNAVLPVELSSFTSLINNRDVTLNWSTSSEVNNSGFDIERSSNGTWSKVGNVSGNGTTNSAMNYSYTDRGLTSGNYSYRLKQIDFNGNFEYFNLSNEVNIGVPAAYELSQNYPNPFNPSTSISFNIPTDGIVSLKLFDMSGKEVSTLVNEVKTAGYYSVNFNAANLTSGIYFYELRADNFSAVKKMMLVK